METIQVHYKPINASGGIYHHKYIVYTDSAGNYRKRRDDKGSIHHEGHAFLR